MRLGYLRGVGLALILLVVLSSPGRPQPQPGWAAIGATSSGPVDFAGFRAQRLVLPMREVTDSQANPGGTDRWQSGEERDLFCQAAVDLSRPAARLVKRQSFDLDGDGRKEILRLTDGRIGIETGTGTVWQSPETWWVEDFLIGDTTNDGIINISLIVWKEGSFGPHRPFWVTEDDRSVKNHLFVFKLENDRVKAVWQSSNLDRPNLAVILADLDNDGNNELIAVEGDYSDPAFRQVSAWRWNGWGFSLEAVMDDVH